MPRGFLLSAAEMESIMMDKKPHIKPYLYGMLAGFGAISLSIIFFFLIYRFDGFVMPSPR